MSTIKINELATASINLSDFFAKADANGLATKNTIQELATVINTTGDVAFQGSLAIADTPSADGWYLASETGTYTNAGSLVIDISNNVVIVIVSGTQTVFEKIDIPISLTLDSTPTASSTNGVESGGVKTYVDRNVLNKQYVNNVITDDTFEDTTNWQKVSGTGTLTFPTLNNKKVLYANDCIVDFVIPVSSIDDTKTWAFGIFVENSVLVSGLRILAQGQTSETSGQVGTRYDYTIPTGDSGKKLTLLSDGFTLDPTANFLRIYIDATGNEIWLSNPFLGNAPEGVFKPVDTLSSLITTAQNTADLGYRDYVNLIPDNLFQSGISYWENQAIYSKNNVTLTKSVFANDYSKYSLSAEALVATATQNWIGIYQDITDIMQPGDTIVFKGLIYPTVASTYLERRFRDVSNNTLTSLSNINLTANQWNYVEFEETIPSSTVYANFFVRNIAQGEFVYIAAWDLHKKNTITKHKINNPDGASATSQTLFYVNGSTGSDSNNGEQSAPFATIGKAITESASVSNPKIIIKEGDYRETVNFGTFNDVCKNIEISAPTGEKVRVLGSVNIATFTKTGGYTNIYQATVSDTIPTHGTHLSKQIIFEDGNPSKSILSIEKHPLQGGLGFRLPYTELIEETFDTDLNTTLTALDARTDGGMYHDTSTNTLYIVTSDQSNPNTNGFNYEYANRNCTSVTTVAKMLNLTLNNIEFWYSSGLGCDTSEFNNVVRNRCRVFGANDNGFQDDSNILYSYREESAGCGNDGQNGHYNRLSGWDSTDERAGTNQAYYFNSWCHDNYDDGCSHHERGEFYTYGGLYEYNWDRGIAPANTAIAESFNPFIRKNGQGVGIDVGAVGIGYSVVNSAIGADQKDSCSAIVYNGVLEDNTIGVGVQTTADNFIILENCVARENTSFNYSADYGTIYANNCKSTQTSGFHKSTTNGGTITVVNDADLS